MTGKKNDPETTYNLLNMDFLCSDKETTCTVDDFQKKWLENTKNVEKEDEFKAEIAKVGETMRLDDFKDYCTIV